MFVCYDVCICLSVMMSVCLSVMMSVCLSVMMSVCLSVMMSVCLSGCRHFFYTSIFRALTAKFLEPPGIPAVIFDSTIQPNDTFMIMLYRV